MSGSESWKITAHAPRAVIEAALLRHEDAWDWDAGIVLSGSEIAEDRPEDWRLEAWLTREPGPIELAAIRGLFGVPRLLRIERLDRTDWVTASQRGFDPIEAGRFRVRTPDHAGAADGLCELVIPASRAFGTGQHATTAGCLAMLSHIRSHGAVVRNLADIGTGTGLLAFAALALWPRALATASDIDAVCAGVVADNAERNAVPLGGRAGELTMVIAAGMDHPLLRVRAPYDLLIANILAGPLVELASDFAEATIPGGSLVLAGLLETQEGVVRAAYLRAGFRLAARLVEGDWSILWLRRRSGRASARAMARR
ncbi:MAG: 50S ribosomal protein L11 methyltransferase [Novosphingobium sp.]